MLKSKALISVIMFAGTLSLTAPAFAGERSIEISVRGLDLTRPSAQARLQDRVARAIRTVCGSRSLRDVSDHTDVKRCEAEAKASANLQITDRIAEHKVKRGLAASAKLKLASD